MKLKISDLSCYEQREGWLLDGFNLEASAGDFIEVKGLSYASGAVLADCIAGRRNPESGSVLIEKEEDFRSRKPAVSIIDRETSMLPYLTLWENLLLVLGAVKKGLSGRAAAMELRSVQEKLDLFQSEYKLPEKLSVRELDRARLAMAVLADPEILVINGLSSDGTEQERRAFADLARSVCKAEDRIVVMIETFGLI